MSTHLLSVLDVVESTAYCGTCGHRVRVTFETGRNGVSIPSCINRRVGGPPPIEDTPAPTKGDESDVQKAITDALTLAGCDWWQTSAWKQKGSSGVTPGIPDILVRLPSMAHGIAIGIEVKAAKGKARRDQTEAFEKGLIAAVVRSPVEALRAVDARCGTVSENERLRLRRILESLEAASGFTSPNHARVGGL